MNTRCMTSVLGGVAVLTAITFVGTTVFAQVTPPDLTVCDSVTCETLNPQYCTPAGYDFQLKDYISGSQSQDGSAIYVYEICNPTGTCDANSGNKAGSTCTVNSDCWGKCTGSTGSKTCNNGGGGCTTDAQCQTGMCTNRIGGCPAANDAQAAGLSHLDVMFPALGPESCLPADTDISGTCACSGGCSVDSAIVQGDGSCFESDSPVAKCNNVTGFGGGSCLTMTLVIPGESTDLGLGVSVVVDKEGSDCKAGCVEGPVCAEDSCVSPPPPESEPCLTRTSGFWGTHPHLIQSNDPRSLNLLPIYVCGSELDSTGGTCLSTSEALCSNAADCKRNPPYLAFLAQLTAAKLNLAATAEVSDPPGAACGDWTYEGMGPLAGMTIADIISECEANFCDGSKKEIGNSGCIVALDAFNQDQDTGFDTVPSPFEHPGPALVGECQDARGDHSTLPGGGSCGCE